MGQFFQLETTRSYAGQCWMCTYVFERCRKDLARSCTVGRHCQKQHERPNPVPIQMPRIGQCVFNRLEITAVDSVPSYVIRHTSQSHSHSRCVHRKWLHHGEQNINIHVVLCTLVTGIQHSTHLLSSTSPFLFQVTRVTIWTQRLIDLHPSKDPDKNSSHIFSKCFCCATFGTPLSRPCPRTSV